MAKYCLITTACDKQEVVDKIIDELLVKNLAACCQVSNIESKYWWNGEIEENKEFLISIKTKKSLFEEVKTVIQKNHDYELCEVLCYDIADGDNDFLNWIDEETK